MRNTVQTSRKFAPPVEHQRGAAAANVRRRRDRDTAITRWILLVGFAVFLLIGAAMAIRHVPELHALLRGWLPVG